MKRYDNEQKCQNGKVDNAQNCQSLDAGDYIRRGQHLHDEAVYMALNYLINRAGKVFSIGHDKGLPPVMPKKGSRRGWVA
jgi:hypothetical protein